MVNCYYIYFVALSCTVAGIADHSKQSQQTMVNPTRLKSRYSKLLQPAKTDLPKHHVTQYVRLALVENENATLKDKSLNELTKLTMQGDVDKILKKKEPLCDLRDIFHYEGKPCPRLILIMGGPGEY